MFSSEFSEICKNRFIERLWWLLFRGGELLDFCLLSIYRRWFSVPLFLPLRGSAVGCCRRAQHRRVFGVYALYGCRGILLGLAGPRVPLVGRGWIWWWGLRLLLAGFAWLWWALAIWLGGARGFPSGWGILVRSWNLLYYKLLLILFLWVFYSYIFTCGVELLI